MAQRRRWPRKPTGKPSIRKLKCGCIYSDDDSYHTHTLPGFRCFKHQEIEDYWIARNTPREKFKEGVMLFIVLGWIWVCILGFLIVVVSMIWKAIWGSK